MKIIFLDIDGVLAVNRQEHDKYGALFHDNFVDNLKHIIDETEASIVITSTWRLSGEDVMLNMWKDRNMPGILIGSTPILKNQPRGNEIKYFIESFNGNYAVKRHGLTITNYVILDDDIDMLDYQLPHFVHTYKNLDHSDYIDLGYGLTKECAEQAIKILNE